MRIRNEENYLARRTELMEMCYDCYAEKGLDGTGIRDLGEFCKCNPAQIYTYFENLDDLIISATEHCMSKVEEEFMSKAPTTVDELDCFIDEIPYWTAKTHGKRYRLMYQIYTHPKYKEYGKKFFEGVNKRYTEYAKSLEDNLGIPYNIITPLIFIFVRACVHYALFEDEFYLKMQTSVLKQGIHIFLEKYNKKTEV